jgi:hypothetical protein
MTGKFIGRFATFALLGFALSASAFGNENPKRYAVSMQILNAGAVVGEPSVVAESGVPAKIKWTGADGEQVDVTVTATPNAEAKIRVLLEVAVAQSRQTDRLMTSAVLDENAMLILGGENSTVRWRTDTLGGFTMNLKLNSVE